MSTRILLWRIEAIPECIRQRDELKKRAFRRMKADNPTAFDRESKWCDGPVGLRHQPVAFRSADMRNHRDQESVLETPPISRHDMMSARWTFTNFTRCFSYFEHDAHVFRNFASHTICNQRFLRPPCPVVHRVCPPTYF